MSEKGLLIIGLQYLDSQPWGGRGQIRKWILKDGIPLLHSQDG